MKALKLGTAVLFCLGVAGTAPAAAASGLGGLAGRVQDTSGAALPGVTVTASCSKHSSLASTVTNSRGEYVLEGLPPGSCAVAFELTGFEAHAVRAVELRADETSVLDRELSVAPISETVDVVAQRLPEREPPMVEPIVPVVPSLRPVPPFDLASVCGPTLPTSDAPPLARVAAHRFEGKRWLYGRGDVVVLDGGSAAGLKPGDNFVVRRRFEVVQLDVSAKSTLVGEHTAGLVQIVDAREHSADAIVVWACSAFSPDDYVAPFVPSVAPPARPRGTPAYDQAGSVLFADEGRSIGSPRNMMVTDLGQNQGAQLGQRVTIFRQTRDPQLVTDVGEAVIVSLRPDSSTIRVEYATDAVFFGDRVAPQR
jgi:hypothetical protein